MKCSEFDFKLCLVGNYGTGKTSLMHYYISGLSPTDLEHALDLDSDPVRIFIHFIVILMISSAQV
jgi:GTPase SAR1 family protein